MSLKNNILALLGAAVGGLLGYFVFFLVAGLGFYAIILPGALVGFGASMFKDNSRTICIVCGFSALALGLFTEWRFAPFVKDDSLGYFLTHIHQLSPITLILIIAGALIGFWAPFHSRKLDS